MINYQLGRRNISPEQQSYLTGVQYEREKGKQGGTGANQYLQKAQNDLSAKTAERLARQYKVTAPTIKRDAQYARAVNAIEKAAGGNAKSSLLSRGTKVTKQDAVKLETRSLFLANSDTLQPQLKCARTSPYLAARE